MALLPWPTSANQLPLVPVGADGVIDHAPGTESDSTLAAVLAAVESLDRTSRVVRVAADPTATGPGARPFWADLVGDPDYSPVAVIPPSGSGVTGGVVADVGNAPSDTDLIITSLRPERGGDQSSDLVALIAARLLRVGGILVVLTHCDWSAGELIDPTGAMVASAQNADLLYLQHIVALHAPVSDGRFATESLIEPDGATAENEARAEHRAAVRGLPAPHRRIHSDVLVFAQPHAHEPPLQTPTAQTSENGVIR
ncbi:hypothetical protein [Saccharothrix texasensis]|uniref:hypothetical protein n=1 Tax=Saccharothrix texasensis TaxID=103734 RepID=UPI001FE28540|nr:hypothetical protein [Saccharothrix texasensis]